MESLSGKQVKDIKDLYQSIYKVEESNKEENLDEYINSLTEEEKKNIFQRAFDKFMRGPDYGNKRKKEKEEKINQQVDDYVEKNKNNKPINKVNVDDKQEPITINLPNGGTKKIYPASSEYDAAKKGELTTSKSDSSMVPDVTNIKKNEKGQLTGNLEKPKTSAMGVDIKKIENDTKIDIEKNTNPSGKVIPKPTKPLMKNSPAAKAGIPLDMRQKFANQNAAFQATKNKDSGYTKMDFIKDFPSSQTAKKFNKGQPIPGFSYKKNLKNSYEPYDLVLDYVLTEGHAETVEEAHYVMMQMDEGTIQTIVEKEQGIFKSSVLNKKFEKQPEMTEKGKKILPKLNDPIINGKNYNQTFGISTGSQKALDMLKN